MNGFEDEFEGVRGKKIRFIATISSEISASYIAALHKQTKSLWDYFILAIEK